MKLEEMLPWLVPAIIAVAVAWIAGLQYRTARSKLALDLFDKRMAVYTKVRQAVSTINATGYPDKEAELCLLSAIDDAQFLFGKDIQTYLESLWETFIKLSAAKHSLSDEDQQIRAKAAQAQTLLFSQVTKFYNNGADRFGPYMRMDNKIPKAWFS